MLSEISLLQGGMMKSHVHLNHFLERTSVTVRFYFRNNRSKLKKHRKEMAFACSVQSYALFFWRAKIQPVIIDLNFSNVLWSKKNKKIFNSNFQVQSVQGRAKCVMSQICNLFICPDCALSHFG